MAALMGCSMAVGRGVNLAAGTAFHWVVSWATRWAAKKGSRRVALKAKPMAVEWDGPKADHSAVVTARYLAAWKAVHWAVRKD